MGASKSTIVRDFGGGLNVVDDDLNLSSEFQTILDNVHRGVDNTLSVRWGTELFVELRLGSTSTATTTSNVIWTLGSRSLTLQIVSHAFVAGDHITFTSQWNNMLGLKSEEIINKPLGVRRVIDANQIEVLITTAASVAGSDASSKTWIRDNHQLAGNIIDVTYYNEHLVVFDDVGEVVKINAAKTITKIWSQALALALPQPPAPPAGWSAIGYVSTAIFKGALIACNGVDKPLIIDFSKTPNVRYLADVNGSSVNVPIGKYVASMDRWVCIAGDPIDPWKVHISATDSALVWYGDAGSDGVYIELNNTNSASVFIRGINRFRNMLAVAFDDTVAMVELGVFDGGDHKPEVRDSVARHGAIAHKTMIFLGFDLLMADPIGIPSFAKSQFDSSVIPSRMSEFIAPLIQKNINRLSTATLERDVFSVYSTHDNRYITFVPNYDNIPVKLPNNPLYHLAEFVGQNRVLVRYPNHGMEEGDLFSLSGVVGNPNPLPSTCTVDTVLNNDIVSFLLGAPHIIQDDENYGGANVQLTRLKTETTAYALTYNKGLKIKAWSRYRGWSFRAGCTSLYGRVFLATASRVYKMGNRFEPIYGDFMGVFDKVWATSTAYTIGQRIKDTLTDEVYTVALAHTSSATGTFAEDRHRKHENWSLYRGMPINFAVELPWADFDKRDMTKILKTINVDAKGTEHFKVQMFLDYHYKHKLTGIRTPNLSMDMVGGDEGALGVALQYHGTGRMAIRQRNWPFQARAKLFKMRLEGAAVDPLRFVSFMFSYKLVGRDR